MLNNDRTIKQSTRDTRNICDSPLWYHNNSQKSDLIAADSSQHLAFKTNRKTFPFLANICKNLIAWQSLVMANVLQWLLLTLITIPMIMIIILTSDRTNLKKKKSEIPKESRSNYVQGLPSTAISRAQIWSRLQFIAYFVVSQPVQKDLERTAKATMNNWKI